MNRPARFGWLALAGFGVAFLIGFTVGSAPGSIWPSDLAAWVQAIGSVAAIGAAIWIDRGTERRRLREREEARRAVAIGLLAKLISIEANLSTFARHLEDGFATLGQQPPGTEPWQVIKGIAANPPPITFSIDEMALVLSLGQAEILNEIMSLDRAHNWMSELFDLVTQKRDELATLIPPEEFDGNAAVYRMPRANVVGLARVRMIEINELLSGMRGPAVRDTEISGRVLRQAHAALRAQKLAPFDLEVGPPREAAQVAG